MYHPKFKRNFGLHQGTSIKQLARFILEWNSGVNKYKTGIWSFQAGSYSVNCLIHLSRLLGGIFSEVCSGNLSIFQLKFRRIQAVELRRTSWNQLSDGVDSTSSDMRVCFSTELFLPRLTKQDFSFSQSINISRLGFLIIEETFLTIIKFFKFTDTQEINSRSFCNLSWFGIEIIIYLHRSISGSGSWS